MHNKSLNNKENIVCEVSLLFVFSLYMQSVMGTDGAGRGAGDEALGRGGQDGAKRDVQAGPPHHADEPSGGEPDEPCMVDDMDIVISSLFLRVPQMVAPVRLSGRTCTTMWGVRLLSFLSCLVSSSSLLSWRRGRGICGGPLKRATRMRRWTPPRPVPLRARATTGSAIKIRPVVTVQGVYTYLNECDMK